MVWVQNYDPMGNAVLSTLLAAVPIVCLLGSIALLRIHIHWAAVISLGIAFLISVIPFRMPLDKASASAVYGICTGLFPIGWIVLNLIFLYQLTVEKGLFAVLRTSLSTLAPDPRVQVILIAFSFGAFFEGAAGFGTPVAVTSAILIQLGFRPLMACSLSLIANTAPVAYGALGTPIVTLAQVTGLDELKLSAMAGRQLPFFSLLVPFWVVFAMCGIRRTLEVWPAALVAGIFFAVPQFLISNFHGPWLVDIVSSICSMGALAVLLSFWKPRTTYSLERDDPATGPANAPVAAPETPVITRSLLVKAWAPWIILSLLVFIWGTPRVKKALDNSLGAKSSVDITVPLLHGQVQKAPPVAPPEAKPENAIFKFRYLSATGTGILVAALIAGIAMGYRVSELGRIYLQSLWRVRFSLLTIAAMLGLGYVTKYSGTDATLGLALAGTGAFYPFFGTLLGWLGVALTGSDTASNVLFGGLQKVTSEKLGLSPILMAAANSTGGVMGKMVDAQSIVVASTATNWYGHEGEILRYVFFHSIALAALMGILVTLQAYVPPFTSMLVH